MKNGDSKIFLCVSMYINETIHYKL